MTRCPSGLPLEEFRARLDGTEVLVLRRAAAELHMGTTRFAYHVDAPVLLDLVEDALRRRRT